MSNPTQANSNKPQAPASSVKPATPFNYAAAAAKSKAQATEATSPAAPNGKASNSTPAQSSNLNPSAGAVNDSNGDEGRQGAVSMPKAVQGGPRQGPAGGNINFGSVHDSNAMLSSSPAVQPTSGQHLQGDKPALFGSVAASEEDSKKKVVGFAGKEGVSPAAAPAAPRPAVDFQKLFQGGGNKGASKTAPAAPTTTSASPQGTTASVHAPAQPSNVAAAAAAPSPAPASAASAVPSSPAATLKNASSTALKPPSTPSSIQQHAGAAPFEPGRSPAQHFQQQQTPQGMRVPGGQPFYPQGGAPGQPRSPHMGGQHTPHMTPMMAGGQQHMPQWQQQQQHGGYHPPQHQMYSQVGYGYQHAPPPHWSQYQQQQQSQHHHDNAGSPHRNSIPASPMGPHPSISAASSTPGMSSPASSRAQAVPYSPSTAPSNVSSPQPHGTPLGMSYGRPAFHPQGSSFSAHAPSPSFSGMGNPSMSPAATRFEPQKRMSSAIRIVNPNTKAEVAVTGSAKSTPAPQAASAAPASSPQVTPASVAVPSTPTPAPKSTPSANGATPAPDAANAPKRRAETAQDFQAKVKAAAEENKRKKAAEKEAAEKEASANEEQDKKQEAEAAEKRAEEEKAAKAAEEEAARKEAEKKELEAKQEAERKEREAKEAAEKEEQAAKEKAASEAAQQKEAEEQKSQKPEGGKLETVDENSATGASHPASEETSEKKEAGQDASSTSRSVADIERMAREVSSVPSTPLEGGPMLGRGASMHAPQTPRTPGTPGFAGLPAKPLATLAASQAASSASSITLDSAQLEKKRKPTQVDTTASAATATPSPSTPSKPTAAADDTPPVSAASVSLGSAKFIEDLSKVAYPNNVQSPKSELNESAKPGKFRYDRDFLLQFMGVYGEKPEDMPSLASIGMEQGQGAAAGGRGGSGRRASGLSAPSGSGRGGLGIGGASFGRGGAGAGAMGSFAHPAKTSEERFAQANAGIRPAGGAFPTSGPMGAFTSSNRTQPLARGGSGSGALPSREMMGTGAPAGSRTQSRRGRTREPGQGRGDRVNPPEKGGPTIPMDQVAPLANSENRWQAGGTGKLSQDAPELVQRKVKSLLNKLTIEKFDSISDQILEWGNKSKDEDDGRTLRQVIALIFEKATDEAAWSEMYAQLCRKLMEQLSSEVTDESLKTTDGKFISGGSLFRKYLLNRCQEDFERGWEYRDAMVDAAKSKEAEDKAKKEQNEKADNDAKEAVERGEKVEEERDVHQLSEEYYTAQKAKRRGLGLVRFIGELFKLQMLTERIMHLCIKKLLANATDPEEEEIESLCKLMTTVGRQLDTEKARAHIDIYFQRMTEMSNSESVNSRMRFMLLDVIELRAAGWKGKQDSAGPKSIAQIHEDAAKQKLQAEMDLAARSSGRGGPPSRGGSRRGQPGGGYPGAAVGPDGWTAVGGAPPPPRPARVGDMSNFGVIQRSGSGRPLTMGGGPNSVFAKKAAKTSEDGSKPPSRTSSSANMFEMLNQSEADQQAAAAAATSASSATERPKLKLAPRTKPVPGEDGEEQEEAGEDDKADEEDGGAAAAGDADEVEEMSDEKAKQKIDEDVKEFLNVRDIGEGVMAMEGLPTSRRPEFLGKIIETVLNKKEDDVRAVARLLSKAKSDGLLADNALLEEGFDKAGISFLEDISIDIPNVYKFMAILLVASGLAEDKIEKLAESIEGDGIKPPKQKLLEKVKDEREAAA